MNDFSKRVEFAKSIAKEAGNEIKRIRHHEDVHTKSKGLNDVLTIADVASKKMIVDKIKELFPNDTIIAEEGGTYYSGTSEYSWAIDPLDGTMNYSRNMPYYCVSVGFLKNNKPEGGAIYIPEVDELYYCERGKGAFCNDKEIHVSRRAALPI